MRKMNWMVMAGCALALAALPCVRAEDGLAAGFADVPMANRPWCYWWWVNGHVWRQ